MCLVNKFLPITVIAGVTKLEGQNGCCWYFCLPSTNERIEDFHTRQICDIYFISMAPPSLCYRGFALCVEVRDLHLKKSTDVGEILAGCSSGYSNDPDSLAILHPSHNQREINKWSREGEISEWECHHAQILSCWFFLYCIPPIQFNFVLFNQHTNVWMLQTLYI